MCNDLNCSHDNLNDDLGDIFGDDIFASPVTRADRDAGLDLARAQQVRVTHEERCPSCRGSGIFRSYTGRVVGDCFKCKGKGVLTYRTSVEQREKGREAAARRADKKQADLVAQADAWKRANPNEASWLFDASQRGFEFAVSLNEALLKWGALTPNQAAAVTRATAKWIAAAKARAEAPKAEVEITKIATSLNKAKGSIKNPKLRLADFVFSLAGANSANAGAVYVKTNGDVYLGKVQQGRFSRSRDCTADLEAQIIAAAADPEAAAVAYGKAFGRCSCCGRELSNPESIARSIGPICAERFGW